MTVVLVVLDGFGLSDDPERNALMAAPMWNWHRIIGEFPHAQLGAAGADVGLIADHLVRRSLQPPAAEPDARPTVRGRYCTRPHLGG